MGISMSDSDAEQAQGLLPDMTDQLTGPYLDLVRTLIPDLAGKVMVFIDWAYLLNCLNAIRSGTDTGIIDVAKFGAKLVGRRRLIRIYVYDGKIERPPNDMWRERQAGQQRFEAALAHVPDVEIRWGRLQFTEGRQPRQKGVDVLLSLDMLRFALKSNYDTAILVSGDGDYADVVRMVKDEGKRVELVAFPESRSWTLLQAADTCVEVDMAFLTDCWRTQVYESAGRGEDGATQSGGLFGSRWMEQPLRND